MKSRDCPVRICSMWLTRHKSQVELWHFFGMSLAPMLIDMAHSPAKTMTGKDGRYKNRLRVSWWNEVVTGRDVDL